MNIQLPDGTVKEFPAGSSALDVAKSIGERLANATIAAEVDGTIVDAMRPLDQVCDQDPIPMRLLTTKDPEALGVLRHSCAHIMARAVMRCFDGVGLAFGPTTGNGFYYDFDLETPISEEDFPRIFRFVHVVVDLLHILSFGCSFHGSGEVLPWKSLLLLWKHPPPDFHGPPFSVWAKVRVQKVGVGLGLVTNCFHGS